MNDLPTWMSDPSDEAGRARSEPHGDALLGPAVFLAISLGGTSAAALACHTANAFDDPKPTRLLVASVAYCLTMGWPPLLALLVVRRWSRGVPRRGSANVRSGPREHIPGALGLALALVSVAALLAWIGGEIGLAPRLALHGNAEPELAAMPPTLTNAGVLLMAFLATAACLWTQALAEEMGWRGYLLPRLAGRVGPVAGVFLHGVLWGLWYAPVLLLRPGEDDVPTRTVGAALVTCTLLGALLGGVRMVVGSIVPTLAANLAITLAAGLPYVLHGADAGLRSAVFGPAGWIATALLGGLWLAVIGRREAGRNLCDQRG